MAPLIATTLAMARDQMPHLPRRLMRRALALRCIGLLVLGLGGCGDTATLPVKAGIGPDPTLPPPVHTLLPTVNIAPAKGWPAGAGPSPAAGLAVNAYAEGLDHPHGCTCYRTVMSLLLKPMRAPRMGP